jgi:hypothetical protein
MTSEHTTLTKIREVITKIKKTEDDKLNNIDYVFTINKLMDELYS